MIKTNSNELKGRFIITDDVNKENIEFIKNHYNNSIVKLQGRFDIPQSGYNLSEIIGSSTFEDIDSKLEEVYQLMKKGVTTVVQGETPFFNFKTKVNYWCNTIFKKAIDNLDVKDTPKIIVENDISKHEYTFLYWLYSCGADIVVITKNINKAGKISDEVQLNIFNTNENLEYRSEILENVLEVVNTSSIKSLYDIETALYEKNSIVKVLVSGMNSYVDTCDFYGKIYIESESGQSIKLYKDEFDNPTQDEINKIPRFKKDEHSYILQTMLMFLNIKDKSKQDILRKVVETEFNTGTNKDLKGTILYNKLVYSILVLNKLVNSDIKHIVIFCTKDISKNDVSVINILAQVDFMSIVLLSPSKETIKTHLCDSIGMLELESSVELAEIPQTDSRSNVRTTGAVASKIAQETLYSGDLLGMYKPGQFCTCETKLFSTAYEEIELWWNKELYNRPQFKANGVSVTLPVMFKVINGVPNNCTHAVGLYNSTIVKKYLYGNTVLCRSPLELSALWSGGQTHILHATDINGTEFQEQKPFYSNGKLNKQKIKQGKNYKYGFLNVQKQDFILNKIEEVLNTEYIVYQDKADYIDKVLNILLNLSDSIVQIIQWFEFYTDNPNLVLVMPDKDMLKLEDIILLIFMHIIGFDILVFVPTCYRSLDGMITPKFQYDVHNIGLAYYDVTTCYLKVEDVNESSVNKPNKKKGFFSKLFGG